LAWRRGATTQPLNLLCACLSAGSQGRNLDAASAVALADPSADLVRLAQMAGRHLVTPTLAACIGNLKLRQRLPEDFRLYLEFVYAENSRRNQWLRQQLGEVAASLNAAGIEPVLLKGAIRLADNLYPDPSWRFMRDLDLLVSRHHIPDALAALKSLGYGFTQSPAGWSEQHKHLPPLGREGDAAVIEIHVDLLPDQQELCPAKSVLANSRPINFDGARVRVPDITDQLAHLIGHDWFDGYLRRSKTFLLRSAFEIVLLCRGDGSHAQHLLARTTSADFESQVRVQLALAARLFSDFGADLPNGDPAVRLQMHLLLAAELWDANGRLRRLAWFARLRLGKLLEHRPEREHLMANILSTDYYRRCIYRLHRLWTSD
jgi:Uncharacterised nucleotidyltransferase